MKSRIKIFVPNNKKRILLPHEIIIPDSFFRFHVIDGCRYTRLYIFMLHADFRDKNARMNNGEAH